jgi:hypothetical protein
VGCIFRHSGPCGATAHNYAARKNVSAGDWSYICCSTFETDEYLQQRNGLSMLSCSHKMDEMIARGSFLLPTPWAQPPVTLETARAQCNLFCPMTNLKLAGSCT